MYISRRYRFEFIRAYADRSIKISARFFSRGVHDDARKAACELRVIFKGYDLSFMVSLKPGKFITCEARIDTYALEARTVKSGDIFTSYFVKVAVNYVFHCLSPMCLGRGCERRREALVPASISRVNNLARLSGCRGRIANRERGSRNHDCGSRIIRRRKNTCGKAECNDRSRLQKPKRIYKCASRF